MCLLLETGSPGQCSVDPRDENSSQYRVKPKRMRLVDVIASRHGHLTVKSLSMGIQHTCALPSGDSVKFWGYNAYGQLGLGDTAHRGDEAGEVGDNLHRVNLGEGITAKSPVSGHLHTCALLSDDSIKCWGLNYCGRSLLSDESIKCWGYNYGVQFFSRVHAMVLFVFYSRRLLYS